MKALSTTLIIVISAVVILVAALVVLTIFGQGVGQVATLAQAKSACQTEGRASCQTTGVLPLTWSVPTKNVQNEGYQSCKQVLKDMCGGKDWKTETCNCNDYNWPTPQ